MSSLYYSGDTGTNRGTSLRRPWDARRRAQIRSDVLCQAAEDLVNEQAQVERHDLLSRFRWMLSRDTSIAALDTSSFFLYLNPEPFVSILVAPLSPSRQRDASAA
jgi:hypothetical protein